MAKGETAFKLATVMLAEELEPKISTNVKFLALGVLEIMAILDWYQVSTAPNLILE